MMRWLKPFFAVEQPLQTINRWLDIIYCVVLLVLAFQIGLSIKVVLLCVALIFLHFGNQKLSGSSAAHAYFIYFSVLLEFILLIVLNYGVESERSSTIFVIYTTIVILNYPGYFALPFILTGYLIYLFFVDQRPIDLIIYLFSSINFSIMPLSLMGLRLLIDQRQHILDLNRRIQSQAELMAEMSKLRERNNLAEAMHDTIGHTLTSAIVSLEGATLLLEKRPAEAIALLDSVREQLQESLGDIRQTVRALKTDILADHTTLKESLLQLAERVRRQTSVAIELQNQLAVNLLPIQEYVLYSIAREGITNALKHGQPTHIQITLAEMPDNCMALTITDNGAGTNSFMSGFGLTHLEQKVQALGGVLSIETEAKAGFRLHVLLPLALDAAIQPRHKILGKVETYD